ncbi:SusC/RagA family TonB-linked outer membrane protein [Sphingobacterium sp.]|uniref:SusC/RagA family TonB-linked outer membrane protein n=1 Tax=Sphingobacterium sp. TaxID=341027 RepID=UPI0028975F52|nr:SusC/RagA family TonB-linked outer membrane protein [Sphingobacterium sp.]
MNKKLLLFCSGVMLSTSLWAQTKTVTGKVTSASDGGTMANVTVSIKGKPVSTQTNPDGSFTIKADPGDILIFRAVGSKERQQIVGSDATINITLSGSEEALEEVVVTAMGIKKEKKALGYAVQDIKSDELMKNKNPNVINSLNGKIAGLNITNSGGAPGASASIIIRGGSSLERDNQPLFVIDGMPIDNSTGVGDMSAFDGSTNISTTSGNRAMDINPEDIESISVLKGPTAAALYGIRAAAGAIVITTKKGKDGAVTIGVNSRLSANWVNKLPKQQSIYKQGTSLSGTVDPNSNFSWGDKFAEGETIYDNLEDFFKTGYTYDNNFNVTGGNKNGNFYLSGGNLKQTGIIPTTDYDRTNFRLNGEQRLGIMTFGGNAAFSQSKTTKTLTGTGLWGTGGNGYLESIIAYPRNANMKNWQNADGSQNLLLPAISLEANVDNPYWTVNMNPQTDKTNRFLGTFYTNAKFTDWLDFTYRLGLDNYTSTYTSRISSGSSVVEQYQKGMLSQNVTQYTFTNHNFLLNAHKVVAQDWDLSLLLGAATEDLNTKTNAAKAQNFILPNFYAFNNAADKDKFIYDNLTQIRRLGVFGDFKVGYKNLAYLGATLRNDWSSTLPEQNRSFMYPSFSGSLIFSELLPKSDVFTYGKIRASWAEVGKDAPAYQTNSYLEIPQNTIGGGFRNSWTLGNSNLKPEKTQSFEVGTDLKFLGNRLGVEFTYYNNKSVDQILSPRVDNATGGIFQYVNAGNLQNKGLELTINTTPIKRENFSWDLALNMSHNKGKVNALPGGLAILYVTDVQVADGKAASFNDGDFMGISGKKWRTNQEGELLLDWTTGYPSSDGNATYQVGNREPKFLGGLNNSFTYKNWNFSFLFDFRKGGDILNGTEYQLAYYGLSRNTENRGDKMLLTGVSTNPTTNQVEHVTREITLDQYYYQNIYAQQTANFVETVNWLRLRSVNLSYDLPNSVFQKVKWIKGANFTLNATNLLLFTNYSGMDPEVSAAGAGVKGSGSVGIDYAGVPNTKSVTFGVNLKF